MRNIFERVTAAFLFKAYVFISSFKECSDTWYHDFSKRF